MHGPRRHEDLYSSFHSAPSPSTKPPMQLNPSVGKAMTSAADQALGISQLLEAILLQVSDGSNKCFSTIVLSARVCSFFKATIDSSPKFQRALFF